MLSLMEGRETEDKTNWGMETEEDKEKQEEVKEKEEGGRWGTPE